MSTSAAGTTFTLRTPAHIKSCHLTGSWDNYSKRYQMSADKGAGPGWWTLTIKFGSSMPPARYWYYVCSPQLVLLQPPTTNRQRISTSSMATLSRTTPTSPAATSPLAN
jgi:1,4-alpha-glucan branching enzyme